MLIRPVAKSDAAALLAMMAGERGFERGCANVSRIDFRRIDELVDDLGKSDHMFVLEKETPPAEICGFLLLRTDPQIYLRNLAALEIYVAAKLQGQGLGKALLKTALDLADNELMIERVEAEIAAGNIKALKLFKSFGFKLEGTAKDWAVSENGGFVDAYLLARCRHR